jgi:hypothetical protein
MIRETAIFAVDFRMEEISLEYHDRNPFIDR